MSVGLEHRYPDKTWGELRLERLEPCRCLITKDSQGRE